jgi:hypothetical protein
LQVKVGYFELPARSGQANVKALPALDMKPELGVNQRSSAHL